MPTEESSEQAKVPSDQASLSPDQSKLPPKPKSDDPKEAIKHILRIVEDLHEKFGKVAVLTKTRSYTPPSNTNSEVPEKENKLEKAVSLPNVAAEEDDSERYIPKLKRNLRLLNEDVIKLQELRSEVADEVGKHIKPLNKLLEKVDKDSVKAKLTKGMKKDLEDINKKIFNLMCQVPLLPNKRRKPGGLDSEDGDLINNGKGIECLPGIHANEEDFKRLKVSKDVQEEFKKLSIESKICLLSFAVFPENQEVNRTMLMYWWIGEGILPDKFIPAASTVVPPEEKNVLDNGKPKKGDKGKPEKGKPEDVVKQILQEFVDKRLIEPVENKRKVEPSSYKMTPFVHSALVLISKEIGLFDMYRKGDKPTMHKSELRKVCLVEGSSSQPEAKAKKMPDVNLIETVFNVSERFPDFTFKWFSEDQVSGNKLARLSKTFKYKNLMVFYLGRWERTAKRHIEVENPELMKNLKHMTKLKLLSFQGISRIEKLDDAVCKLDELVILDLRACYNLEKLPEKIDSLKELIYLDITDCYMIDRMPKRLSWLNNLEVLKGFVVSDANDDEKVCLLSELVHLTKLRKLSITINKGGDYNVAQLFRDIKDFQSLEKFKVAWGGINKHNKEVSADSAVRKIIRTVTARSSKEVAADKKILKPPTLPATLRKLDLQCFPDPELPLWLKPQNLGGLEKLYIKGGTELIGFGKLDPKEPTTCKVKILRLKFLPRLKVEWRELKELYFPQLEFLDKYQCPQVSFCPCDGIGIWRDDQVEAILN